VIELDENSIALSDLLATDALPMHRAYVAIGIQTCPACGERMNGVGWATWRQAEMVRTQWRCVNVRGGCKAAKVQATFNLTTRIVDDPEVNL
jgi:hypothetical protein